MAPGTKPNEPEIGIESREQLLYLLTEAAEIEHNLMCCYLFAAFSLKTSTQEGLTDEELSAVVRWRRDIISIAIDEMTHLALVSNLTAALGGAPHFSRPNFPVGAGLYPSGVVVRLSPFDRETLQHFVYLERPEGFEVPDGASFATESNYVRETVRSKCMPSAQDYLTVGHLYRALVGGLETIAARQGESALFIGTPEAQIGPDIVSLPGLCTVTDLKSAVAAIETVVRQGEGTETGGSDSHYARFRSIADDYDAFLARRPDFTPHRPVAANPVMRRPPDPRGKVHISEPETAKWLDLANAVYGLMLRCLAQGFGRPSGKDEKRLMIDTAIDLMFGFVPLAEALTLMPASKDHPGITAGMSFAMLRDVATMPHGPSEWAMISERLGQLADAARKLEGAEDSAASFEALKAKIEARPAYAPAATPSSSTPHQATAPPESRIEDGVEIADGAVLTLRFNAKRCIHARFCVLGAPSVYKANVQGPWIDPDAAPLETNIGIAHNCPSGAIAYERHDGGPEEPAPKVNLVNIRENGPLAFRAPLMIDGAFAGYRATLCRCGASNNKPFCDGSHANTGFRASGEPETGSFEALAMRDGALEIRPQKNGPLAVAGNLEILSGTGRTLMKTKATRLCRCGGSANKPYCDGTHTKIGFTS